MTLETLNDSVQALKSEFEHELDTHKVSSSDPDNDEHTDSASMSTETTPVYTLFGRDIIPIAKHHNWEVRPDRGHSQRLCYRGYRTLHIPLDQELRNPHKTLMAIFQPTLHNLLKAELDTVETQVQTLIEALSPEIVIRQTQVMQDLAAYEAAEKARLEQYRLEAEAACQAELEQQLEADKADLLAAYEEELRELLNDSAAVQQLSAELEAAQRRNASLVAERQTLLAELDSQGQAIAERNVTIAEQASELGQTQLRLQHTDAELSDLRSRWATLQAEHAQLSEHFAQISADYDALQALKLDLEGQLQSQGSTIADLQTQLDERSDQLAATSAELATIQADRDQVRQEVADLTLKLQQAEQTILTLAGVQRELEIVKHNCHELSVQNHTLQAEAGELNRQIEHWQGEYQLSVQHSQQQQQDLERFQADLRTAQQDVSQLNTQLAERQAELARWQEIAQMEDHQLLERVQALQETAAPQLKGLRRLVFGMALAIAILGMGWVSGLIQATSAPDASNVAVDEQPEE